MRSQKQHQGWEAVAFKATNGFLFQRNACLFWIGMPTRTGRARTREGGRAKGPPFLTGILAERFLFVRARRFPSGKRGGGGADKRRLPKRDLARTRRSASSTRTSLDNESILSRHGEGDMNCKGSAMLLKEFILYYCERLKLFAGK